MLSVAPGEIARIPRQGLGLRPVIAALGRRERHYEPARFVLTVDVYLRRVSS
jgi:hypothetical protein